MSWNRESLNVIYERMKADAEARVTGGVRIPRFSLMGVILIVVAGAIHLVYGFLAWLSRQLFLDTAEAEFLDRKGREFGLPRKAATYSEGAIQFLGVPGSVILAGTDVQNSDGIIYATIDEVILDVGGLGYTTIQATTEGTDGNTTENTLRLSTPIAGVESDVTVTEAPTGGENRESDDELRARLFQRVQNPPASGNAADYVRWATSVEGVSKAWVFGAEDFAGSGSVGVVIADGNLNPVSPVVKQDVIDVIDEARPITAAPQVLDVIASALYYEIAITPNAQEVRDAVTQQVETYLLATANPGGTVLISGIRAAITSGGAADYDILAMEKDGTPVPEDDVVLGDYEVGKLDSITFTDL